MIATAFLGLFSPAAAASGDLANQWYDLASARPRLARTQRAEITALTPAE